MVIQVGLPPPQKKSKKLDKTSAKNNTDIGHPQLRSLPITSLSPRIMQVLSTQTSFVRKASYAIQASCSSSTWIPRTSSPLFAVMMVTRHMFRLLSYTAASSMRLSNLNKVQMHQPSSMMLGMWVLAITRPRVCVLA